MADDAPKINVKEIHFSVLPTKTRFPFRYGIAAMTSAPHWFVLTKFEIDGKPARGLTSEGLPPKWFTKNPGTTFEEDDLPGMENSIRHAARVARSLEPSTFFEFWKGLKSGENQAIPPLLAQFGTALMERSLLDGIARALERPLHQLVSENRLGIRLSEIHESLSNEDLKTAFQKKPLSKVKVRHTVGLADPLSDADIPSEDRANDGLPQSLISNIKSYGLTRFKLKLCGDFESDRDRLRDLTRIFEEHVKGDYRITIDGNEQYPDIGSFRDHFASHRADPKIAPLFDHLLFVEQPIHRDHSLEETVREGFENWADAPPVIIDESDSGTDSLPRALELGYAGTSHKNCKGIIKSLANRVLLNQEGGIMSAEDLANLGPVALLQDLAMVALLQIDHAERNGHHYFSGLSMFPQSIQDEVLEKHGDLYRASENGFPTLAIGDGVISVDSVNRAGFGCGLELEAFEAI